MTAEAGPRSRVRVVLDDRPLRRTLTGVGNYIAQLLTHMPALAPAYDVRPFVFTHLRRDDWRARAAAPAPPPSKQRGAHHPTDVGGGRKPWWMRRLIQSAYGVAFRALTRGYRLYHEPNHIPVRCSLPTVTTIHDLSVVVHPEWHPADRVAWYERDFQRGLCQTRVFLAASEFTKREMIERLGIDDERIVVSYQAPRDDFRPAAGEFQRATRESLRVPDRYFLYVGTLEPRKNVEGLLAAYAALPADLRCRCPLLIAGAWGWKADTLRSMLDHRDLSADVRLLGYMHDRQLAALYSGCAALVWPSWYEGFGLPPLEAMACGAPVIVSNVASLPEVVGDAGMTLDPSATAAWTDAMRRVAEDDAVRADLRQRSIARAARFTWQSFIESTVAAYQTALV